MRILGVGLGVMLMAALPFARLAGARFAGCSTTLGTPVTQDDVGLAQQITNAMSQLNTGQTFMYQTACQEVATADSVIRPLVSKISSPELQEQYEKTLFKDLNFLLYQDTAIWQVRGCRKYNSSVTGADIGRQILSVVANAGPPEGVGEARALKEMNAEANELGPRMKRGIVEAQACSVELVQTAQERLDAKAPDYTPPGQVRPSPSPSPAEPNEGEKDEDEEA